MKFKKILMVGFEKGNLGASEWERISALSEKHVILPKDSDNIAHELNDADCLLVKLGATVDKQMIDKAPHLKYIGMFGTGYGKIDATYAAEKGITVCNIAGYATNAVAELTMGLILEQTFGISRAQTQASKGDYSEDSFVGKNYEISGKNFGIVGMGKIGSRIAHIASQGFGAKVSYWNMTRRFEVECHGFTFVRDVKELVAKSDFLSINMAYVKGENENFFNEELISAIKPNSILINTTQMDVIDIKALSKRLAKNDMIFIEDHSDELSEEDATILSQHENCIMYAPIGYITKEATAAKLGIYVDNLENFLKGNPTNKVN